MKVMAAVLLSFYTLSMRPSNVLASVSALGAPLALTSATTKMFLDIFCGGAASVIAVNFVHPIDIVKIRL